VRRVLAIALMHWLSLVGTSHAADEFYAGKIITISVHVGVGGSYDAYVRLLARHFGRHVPGNPAVIVVNQVGAGGLLALNYMARRAPQDGTWLSQVTQSLMLHELTGQPGMQVSLGELNWIGNLSQSNNIAVTWPTSSVKTLDDARRHELRMGATGVGSTSAQLPSIYNALLDTKIKLIMGYKGSAEMDLASRRGELDGRNVTSWPVLMAGLPEGERRQMNALVQVGLRKDPALPHVPLLTEEVRGDARKLAIAQFVTVSFAMVRPIATGPDVPGERVSILRNAFDATMRDPLFLDEVTKMAAEIDPMTGDEVRVAISKVLATPRDLIAQMKLILEAR
jgi:tripartite-type tricarboxylate transporter receptor subunit TctC